MIYCQANQCLASFGVIIPCGEHTVIFLLLCYFSITLCGLDLPRASELTQLPLVQHICQWIWLVLVQVMACLLFVSKPLPQPNWLIVNYAIRNKLQLNFYRNWNIFIDKIAF